MVATGNLWLVISGLVLVILRLVPLLRPVNPL